MNQATSRHDARGGRRALPGHRRSELRRARGTVALATLLSVAAAFVVNEGGTWAAPQTSARAEPEGAHVVVPHRPSASVPLYGPRYAPVTIEFFCEISDRYASRRVYSQLMALAARHPRRLRILFRPIDRSSKNMWGVAALEAAAQGRFHEFVHEAYTRGPATRLVDLEQVAAGAGLDLQQLSRALEEGRHGDAIEENQHYYFRRQASKRPAVLFNGVEPAKRPTSMRIDEYENAYDAAYAAAKELLDRGVPLPRLYYRLLRQVDARQAPVSLRVGMIDGLARGKKRQSEPGRLVTVPLAQEPHVTGADRPEVVLYFFCSFQSRHCAQMYEYVERLKHAYARQLRVSFKHLFDEDDPEQPAVRLVHEASLCAAEQNAFWQFCGHTYDELRPRRRAQPPTLEILRRRGDEIDLDADRFARCIEDRKMSERLEELLAQARRAGVTQTPAVVIGGRFYVGTKGLGELRGLLLDELRPGLLERFSPPWARAPSNEN